MSAAGHPYNTERGMRVRRSLVVPVVSRCLSVSCDRCFVLLLGGREGGSDGMDELSEWKGWVLAVGAAAVF